MEWPNKIVPINKNEADQFLYLNRWVDKKGFRAFVYNREGAEKLADNYDEYLQLTTSGIWFASKQDAASQGKRKQKHDIASPNSK